MIEKNEYLIPLKMPMSKSNEFLFVNLSSVKLTSCFLCLIIEHSFLILSVFSIHLTWACQAALSSQQLRTIEGHLYTLREYDE